MNRNNKNEREIHLGEQYEMRRKNISDYFLKFSRFARPWLMELAMKYKQSGDYLVHPFMLADLYEDEDDMEIALIASLLVDEDKDVYAQVSGLKNTLGDSPFEWYVTRSFVRCGLVDPLARIEGTDIMLRHLAELFQRIWDMEGYVSFDYDGGGDSIRRFSFHDNDLEEIVNNDVKERRETPFMSLLNRLAGVHGIKRWYWRLNFLLVRLYRRDGFGLGLWGNGGEWLSCPVNKDMERFLGTFFPDFRRYGFFDDSVTLLGFDDPTDFLYAYYGYRKLCAEKPEECRTFATTYRKWYDAGRYLSDHNSRLKGILPEIGW